MQAIEKWLQRCEIMLIYAGVLACFLMMCLTSGDALSRYLLNRPILGAYEITEKYLMVATVFLGLSYAYRGGGFIRVTFMVDRLPAALKLACEYFAHIVSLAFCVILLVATAQQALRGLSDATTLSSLPILAGPAYSLVPLGFLAMAILLCIDLTRVHKGQSLMYATEAPTA